MPFIADSEKKSTDASAVGKVRGGLAPGLAPASRLRAADGVVQRRVCAHAPQITLGMKGLAKSLEKTAARLGTMPTKCTDPHEYIQTLVRPSVAALA